MLRDVTEMVLKQSEEYGRKVNLSISRVSSYASKIKHIYKILNKKKMILQITEGSEIKYKNTCFCGEAVNIIRKYGENYFLSIHYTSDRKTILVVLEGEVHPKSAEEKIDRFLEAMSEALELK